MRLSNKVIVFADSVRKRRRSIIFSGALTKHCRCRVLLDSEGGVSGVGGESETLPRS